MRSKELWIIEILGILRRLDKLDDEIRQIVDVNVIPFGKSFAHDWCKSVLERELGQAIDLDGAGIHRSSSRATNAGRPDDGRLHRVVIVGCQDDLVYFPVEGLVGH